MVFHYTSTNIKMMKNIMLDFATYQMSPYEYMQYYLDKCPVIAEENKLSWISKTFIGIEKHYQFLKVIVANMSGEMSADDQYYGIIVLHAITFQITPADMESLYKSLFNISKPLLGAFTNFLSNNEILIYISQVAQATYDTDFITERIISPLFSWQPYISDMAHKYAEYVKLTESRKLKPPTVPLQLNVLNRKSKEAPPQVSSPASIFPEMPPNILHDKVTIKKQLTKSAIDRRLKALHDKNKEKALSLLHEIKMKDFAHTHQSEMHRKAISNINEENNKEYEKHMPKPRPFVPRNKLPPIKDNKANLQRINKRIKAVENEEVEFLHDILDCKDSRRFELLVDNVREEKERERLLEIEKKHVLGQLSYEEAVIAKNKVYEKNRKKYENFLKEKQLWCQEIERWKRDKMEDFKRLNENVSMSELNAADAKEAVINRKKDLALKMRNENQLMLAEAMRTKQEELERRINMIKEIKILSMIANKARVPKIVDFTETGGFGFLCEMSMAELQERLSAMKMCIKDELEKKKALINEKNSAAKQELEEVKISIKAFLNDKAEYNRQKKLKRFSGVPPTKEIIDLKKSLEEKRKLRIKLTNERF